MPNNSSLAFKQEQSEKDRYAGKSGVASVARTPIARVLSRLRSRNAETDFAVASDKDALGVYQLHILSAASEAERKSAVEKYQRLLRRCQMQAIGDEKY